MKKDNTTHHIEFVHSFRNSSGYINAFRGRTFVIAFDGEMLTDEQFAPLVHDIALLNSLGIKLILVHGARPQIESRLKERNYTSEYINGIRITDDNALTCVKEASSSVRADIEALLSIGITNSPVACARISVISGNFVTAQPYGVRDGVDFMHTGEVRKIDRNAINKVLENNSIILLSPIGYSSTGEIFNLSAEDVATQAAIELKADKLIYLVGAIGVTDKKRKLIRELTLNDAKKLLEDNKKLDAPIQRCLTSAIKACQHEVERTHILNRDIEGALLLELFTRDGCGTLITAESFEDIRPAIIEDLAGLIELITPLENEDILVRRSREKLEMEIEHFTVVERDGMIIACAALYPYFQDKVAELACLAVHPDYQRNNRGDQLLKYIERQSKQLGIKQLFVLTTRTAHWFRERGFVSTDIKTLPVKRKSLYNYQRQSKMFAKTI
ncbi:MAG: amino-acid N-acetyltransferase [Gammaproteobacteria bacterium]|nr:amino-acid N-acetyltransferase [Gammaproteobacteria bacterium]MCW8988436.1 amino-acid N-acetyltransferase [Gammaproteobacteria bacterium]